MTGIERFAEIMDTEPTIKDKENAKELIVNEGTIEFQNVTFKYSEDTDEILGNINISIGSGESFALVGPSGGGKTTICNLGRKAWNGFIPHRPQKNPVLLIP